LQNDPKATASQFIKNEYYRLHDKLHYNIVEPFFQVIVLVFILSNNGVIVQIAIITTFLNSITLFQGCFLL